ncbi:MAG: hypothetical protein GY768_16840 [Planctomycetaceae bacterium]|nr:hypothetical protein [Planctomycetaceae bacterium]
MKLDFSLPYARRKATFASIYSEVDLYRAALKTYTKPLFRWRAALSRSHDGGTLYDFARSGHRNLNRVHRRLVDRSFQAREGIARKYHFNNKERTIYIFPWEERIVDQMLFQTLNRYFHSAISKHSYAYRHCGFGIDACQHRTARELKKLSKPCYFTKRDITGFFQSIDHTILLEALKSWIEPDDYLYQLLAQRVKFRFRTEDNESICAQMGVPFGTSIACFLANLYLLPLDRSMEQFEQLTYSRYADDVLQFSPSRNTAIKARDRLHEVLVELKLKSKLSHQLDFSFRSTPHNGRPTNSNEAVESEFPDRVDFRHLGLEFRRDNSIGLSRDKLRKIRNLFRFALRRSKHKFERIGHQPEQRAEHAIAVCRRVIGDGLRSVAIIDYYLKHVDDEKQLRLLDRWLAEEVLSQAFQNGHRKGNFRKLPFSKLREMGLPSLRHRRRLLNHGHLKASFFVLRTRWLIEQERGRLPSRKAFSPCLEAAATTVS